VTPVVCKLLMIESAEPRSAKKIAGHVCSVSGLSLFTKKRPASANVRALKFVCKEILMLARTFTHPRAPLLPTTRFY
jgi:hypothetical protein